jgi:RNA polymerase sigma factor (sigma-70 family)
MDDLIKLVRTYRLTAGLADRVRLAEEIFRLIEPDLRLFVFSRVPDQTAQDVFQEVLKAVATGMSQFEGSSNKEFWRWCYRIARNKLNDQFRRQHIELDHIQPMPPEELWQLVEASAQDAPLSAADRLDLEYAMQLLTTSKPECCDFLWKHFVFGLDYAEIAEDLHSTYDAVRMKIGRCLEEAQSLMS